MSGQVRFRANRNLPTQLARTAGMRAARATIAREAAAAARRIAPTGETGGAKRIEVFQDGDEIGYELLDPFGHLIEFGSVNNPAYAPLRRGARAAGLTLDENQQ